MADSVTLDPVDLEILRLLQNDARISNRALAVAAGVAPSTCLDRVNRLRRAGVILGASMRLDPDTLGFPLQAFLAIQVGPHHREVAGRFVAHVLALPHTRTLYHMAGQDDYLVHVTATDVHDLQRLVLDGFTARPEVTAVRTNLIFQTWTGSPLLPAGG